MKTKLTDRALKALKPRDSSFDVMDADTTAFGVRVMPSGVKRSSCSDGFPERQIRPGDRWDVTQK